MKVVNLKARGMGAAESNVDRFSNRLKKRGAKLGSSRHHRYGAIVD